jgi:hypothetical protein
MDHQFTQRFCSGGPFPGLHNNSSFQSIQGTHEKPLAGTKGIEISIALRFTKENC